MDVFTGLGLEPSVLFAGFLGGVVRAILTHETSVKDILGSPVCGALCAGYFTEIAVHYLSGSGFTFPTEEKQRSFELAVGFIIGICGMWLSRYILNKVSNQISKINQESIK